MQPWKHFCTITKHRHTVIRHCFKAGIGWQGLHHDLSKYSITEFWNSAKYYQGTRSPNDQERVERGYSLSWLHHKGRNKHHYEYWTDYSNLTHQVEPVKMPLYIQMSPHTTYVSLSRNRYRRTNYEFQ